MSELEKQQQAELELSVKMRRAAFAYMKSWPSHYDVNALESICAVAAKVALEQSGWAKLWNCPECAFGFDAFHTDERGGGYSCPLCAEAWLEKEVARLRSQLEATQAELDEDRAIRMALCLDKQVKDV